MSVFKVGDFVGVIKPADTSEFPIWWSGCDRYLGQVCEVVAVSDHAPNAPTCVQLKNPTPGDYGAWFRESWCYLSLAQAVAIGYGAATVNPGSFAYQPAVSNGQVFVTLPNSTRSLAIDYGNDRARVEKPREFDGYCNPCGGLRTHRLGCPTKRKST